MIFRTLSENRRVRTGSRVVVFCPVADAWTVGTLRADTNIYPLREQAAPTPFVLPDVNMLPAHTAPWHYACRVYVDSNVPVMAYVHDADTEAARKGRVAHAAIDPLAPAAPAPSPVDDITPSSRTETPSAPAPMPTAPHAPAPAPTADTAAALAALLATLAPAAPATDPKLAARVDALETAVQTIAAPLRIEITRADTPDAPPADLGVQHHEFPTLLATVQTRLPNGRRLMPWLVGPAGTGKTKAADGVARALGVPLALIGTMTDAFQVLGYMDARGEYVSTPFRNAWEHGGVILLDEADRADAHATVALLGGLDSGVMQFPDARVPMHATCIVIAAGNTHGTGATAQFRAAKAQDSAFADRFVFLDWPHDDALEAALSTNAAWLRYVRAVRAEVRARKLPEQGFDITTRATLDGAAMLAAGMDAAHVVTMAVRRRIPANTWSEICAKVAPFTGGK